MLAAVGVVAAAGACAPARVEVAQPAPEARLSADPAQVARLLRLEDRREFDSTTLAALAGDASPALRARTALALGRLRAGGGVPILRQLLTDRDSALAATAAFALGQVGDSTVASDLARTLAAPVVDRRPTVAGEAAYALGKLHSAEARDSLAAFLVRAPLDAKGEPVGSALLAIWRFPKPSTLEPITRWLTSGNAELRWRAAYALVRRPDSRATTLLAAALADDDPRVRAIAVRGLTASLADSAGLGAVTALPRVIAALRDADYAVRINAARTLGSYRSPQAVGALAGTLDGADHHLAVASLEALGSIGTAAGSAADALGRIASDPGRQISLRQTALESLAHVRPAAAIALADGFARDSSWRLRASASRAFAVAGGALDPRLLALARDADGRVAASALGAALEVAGDSVRGLRPALLTALGSRDIFVRATALGGLATLADPSTLPRILDAYGEARADSLDDAALAAIDALGALQKLGQRPGRSFFLRFPRPSDPLIRLRAARVFGEEARAAWGEPLPIETGRSLADYRALLDRFAEPEPRVTIATDQGTIVLRLHAADAPLTVESFLSLAARGYFDGQEWPRVVPNFVIQGGDPRGDTNGGPGYAIRDEINRYRYGMGTLGMALSGPDTGGSQFFVTHSAQPHLDGIYTIFGEVEAGQDVVERVLPGDRIVHVQVVR
jgi:cyclophilin family peptidyl-prolyl cis-trans isomerase/HEAT repeat protein